jgi:hypothetical protein
MIGNVCVLGFLLFSSADPALRCLYLFIMFLPLSSVNGRDNLLLLFS